MLFVLLVAICLSAWKTLPWASFKTQGKNITVTSRFPCSSIAADHHFRLIDSKRVGPLWRWIEEQEGAGRIMCMWNFTVRFEQPPKFIVLGTPVGYRYYVFHDGKFRQTEMPESLATAFARSSIRN